MNLCRPFRRVTLFLRLRLFAGVLCFLLLPLAGEARKARPSGVPPIRQGSPQLWYGRVNHWADDPRLFREEIRLMVQNGITGYIIEMAGWKAEDSPGGRAAADSSWSRKWIRRTGRAYRRLLGECRRQGIWLFVSVVNDNMGLHKYGDEGPRLQAVYPQALQLVEIIRREGPEGVVVQPVAETQTEAGASLESHCVSALKDFLLVYNGQGGSPRTVPPGFHFRAVHPAQLATPVPPDAFVVSDHGLLIRELTADGSLDAPGHPQKLPQWILRHWETGVPVIGYYAFRQRELDAATLTVIGQSHP